MEEMIEGIILILLTVSFFVAFELIRTWREEEDGVSISHVQFARSTRRQMARWGHEQKYGAMTPEKRETLTLQEELENLEWELRKKQMWKWGLRVLAISVFMSIWMVLSPYKRKY
jgi:hypothetical protein